MIRDQISKHIKITKWKVRKTWSDELWMKQPFLLRRKLGENFRKGRTKFTILWSLYGSNRNLTNRPHRLTQTNPSPRSCWGGRSHVVWTLYVYCLQFQRPNQHGPNTTHPHVIKDNNILANKACDHIRWQEVLIINNNNKKQNKKTHHSGAWRSKNTVREASLTSSSSDRDNKTSQPRQLLLPFFLFLSWHESDDIIFFFF